MTSREGGIRISLVRSWDAAEIVALYRAGGWWKDEYDPAEIPGLIRGSFAFAVALDGTGSRAVGMGRVISDGVSDAYIQDLVVLPAYRKQGAGKALLEALLSACKEAGLSWIALVAEPGSEPFYRELGFLPMKGHVPLMYRGEP
ncbi:GNAT family N-acetyltransferase [Methanoregula sp. UBA64]|uniref:GNAT family N-acetyltransferase n=1 Tax=Methanoregula sp. UBA64 TaxID=1915554 RepID=UPI0025EB9B57|nr:GNAT family N-acetyltransferase [Methanoregula sp. UBA64]